VPPCSFHNGKDVVASLAGNAWARWFSSSSYAFDVCPGGTSAWVGASLQKNNEFEQKLSRKYIDENGSRPSASLSQAESSLVEMVMRHWQGELA